VAVLPQEMLFKKHMKAPECDQAPCGTGMKYLDPSYHRVADIVHHAEFGTPQGNNMGTNQVSPIPVSSDKRAWSALGACLDIEGSERRRASGSCGCSRSS
jgi:hypothetical protein